MIPKTRPSIRCAFLVAVAFGVLATAAGPRLLAEKGYETPPMLEASAVLPEKMQSGDHFKVGIGYNFTDFSEDLTDLSYDHHGFFLNIVWSL